MYGLETTGGWRESTMAFVAWETWRKESSDDIGRRERSRSTNLPAQVLVSRGCRTVGKARADSRMLSGGNVFVAIIVIR
jgi:hypothetical protein